MYSTKRNNLHIIGVPEEGEKEKEAESLFKQIMSENFPNLGRDLDISVPEASKSLQNLNSKQSSPRNITIKLSKIKDK